MNRNIQENTARLELRLSPQNKSKIERFARKCNQSTSQYVLQRALGYEPKAAPPDAFYDFYGKLCELCNRLDEFDAETKAAVLSLAEEIYSAFFNVQGGG